MFYDQMLGSCKTLDNTTGLTLHKSNCKNRDGNV